MHGCYQIVTIENHVLRIGRHFLGNGRGGCVTPTRRYPVHISWAQKQPIDPFIIKKFLGVFFLLGMRLLCCALLPITYCRTALLPIAYYVLRGYGIADIRAIYDGLDKWGVVRYTSYITIFLGTFYG